jgi:hypothetical protein
MTALEQERKSLDREQTALRRAQESVEPEKTATSSAACSVQRENYMFDLMTNASQHMAGTFFHLSIPRLPFMSLSMYYIGFFLSPACSFLDTAAE